MMRRDVSTLLVQIPWNEPLLWLALLAAALGVAVLMRGARARRGAEVSSPAHLQMQRDITALTSELSQMSRNMNEQLDARCAKLTTLLRQADEKIEELRAL